MQKMSAHITQRHDKRCVDAFISHITLSRSLSHTRVIRKWRSRMLFKSHKTTKAYLTVRNLPSFSCGELFPSFCLLLLPRLRESRSKSGGTCDMGGSLLRATNDAHYCGELTKSQVLIHPYRLCNIRGSLLPRR